MRFPRFDPISRYRPFFARGQTVQRGCRHLENTKKNFCSQPLPAHELEIKMPDIPRSFIANNHARRILAHAVDEFGFEERQVIYYYCYLSVSVNGIAWLLEMTELHVASVLGLYSERIKDLLNLFGKALPHNSNDGISIKAILK